MVHKKIATTSTKKHPFILVILDGFGLAPATNIGNAITAETAPHIFSYIKKYPSTTIKTSGKDVGLFAGQEGNSEAGHMNIGSGRVVKQDLVMITDAIADGTFFKNEAFKQALHHIKKYKTSAHVFGLLTDGNSAHAHPEHLYAMLELLHREKIENVYIHLITDGRDSSPHSALEFLHKLRQQMKVGQKIATVAGRFFAMDRNKIWERTQASYDAMVSGVGCRATSAEEAISQAYNRGETDEYICPTVITEEKKARTTIQDNDAIFFINARSDRARQITKAFVQDDFIKKNAGAFRRNKRPKNIRFVAMTYFGPDLPHILTAFPSPDIAMCLPLAIGEARKQLYISETEKYAHVTYFINGGYPAPLNGEVRELIRSPKIRSYAKKPSMHCKEMITKIIQYIKNDTYDFICVNIPNADMVGHTGNFIAAKRAVSILDTQLARMIDVVLKKNGTILVTADHGNAEEMIHKKTNEMMTEHTTNPVPCILVTNTTKKIRLKKNGRLADIAPTVLKLLDIKQPKEMSGHTLF